MKKSSMLLVAILAIFATIGLTGCDSEDKEKQKQVQYVPVPQSEEVLDSATIVRQQAAAAARYREDQAYREGMRDQYRRDQEAEQYYNRHRSEYSSYNAFLDFWIMNQVLSSLSPSPRYYQGPGYRYTNPGSQKTVIIRERVIEKQQPRSTSGTVSPNTRVPYTQKPFTSTNQSSEVSRGGWGSTSSSTKTSSPTKSSPSTTPARSGWGSSSSGSYSGPSSSRPSSSSGWGSSGSSRSSGRR